MRKLLRKTSIIAAIVVASLGVAVSPAEAAGGCASNSLCVWTSPNYTGTKKTYTFVRGSVNMAYPMDNNISSFSNTSDWDYKGYYSYNLTGMYINLPNHYSSTSIVGSANNEISSIGQNG